jgi:DNA-binding winged helix-turn-helix (wHTH) protein/Tfp pilus assembly protein PilF
VYSLDPVTGRLQSPNRTLTLRPKVTQLLLALIRAAPNPVGREEIIATVWGDTHVTETSLARLINELRHVLEEEPNAIETLPKRGYRLTLDDAVEERNAKPAAEPPQRKVIFARGWVAAAILAAVLLALGWQRINDNSFTTEPPQSAEERERIARREFQAGYSAWGLWSAKEMDTALERFRRAALVAPDLWFGYTGMADAYLGQVLLASEPNASTLTWARQAAERAVRVGPEIAAAHAALGSAALLADWDWARAELEFDRALSINALSYVTYQRRGLLRLAQGRSPEARADFERSLQLQPEHSDALIFLALTEFCDRNPARALSLLKALPNNPGKRREALRIRAAAHTMQGQFSEALEALASAEIRDLDRLAALAWIDARRGDRDAAKSALGRFKSDCRNRNLDWCDTTLAEAALGLRDDAFACLEEGRQRKHWRVLLSIVDPRLAPLHGDPRWATFVGQVRVPASATR